jgi:intracellular septation protein A
MFGGRIVEGGYANRRVACMETAEQPLDLSLSGPVQTGSILRASGPRVVRDAVGPLLAFYAGWKLVGLAVGIGVATLAGASIFVHERRTGRPGAIARLALGLVFIRAGVGLLSGSAKLYLAQDSVIDVLLGSGFLLSVALGRPITALFAREIYPLPAAVLDSETFSRTFRRVTVMWSVYFFTCAAVRLTVLLLASVDVYVVVAALKGAPIIVAMLVWSIRHTVRSFRQSAEWGAALAEVEAAQAAAATTP